MQNAANWDIFIIFVRPLGPLEPPMALNLGGGGWDGGRGSLFTMIKHHHKHKPQFREKNEKEKDKFVILLLWSLGGSHFYRSYTKAVPHTLQRVFAACSMNSMKPVIPLHSISWKKTPNDAVTPQCQGQFTPKISVVFLNWQTVPRVKNLAVFFCFTSI